MDENTEFIINHNGLGFSPVTNGRNYLRLINYLSFNILKILPYFLSSIILLLYEEVYNVRRRESSLYNKTN